MNMIGMNVTKMKRQVGTMQKLSDTQKLARMKMSETRMNILYRIFPIFKVTEVTDWSDARIKSDQNVARIQVTFIGTLQERK